MGIQGLIRETYGSKSSTNLDDIVTRASSKYGVDPNYIKSVIKAESNFDPRAVSSAGAKGLMQLMDATAGDLGVTDSFDPEQNIMAGTKYLAQNLQRYGGDPLKASAAYNAGPGNVDKAIKAHGDKWLENLDKVTGHHAKETQQYLKNITRHYSGGEPQTTASGLSRSKTGRSEAWNKAFGYRGAKKLNVNSLIQDIYGQKEPEPGYLEVIGKGMLRGVEGLAGGIGSATRWAGEAVLGSPAIAEIGKTASEYWRKAQTEGIAKPSKEVYEGSFLDKPSFKRAVGIVSEAVPSLGAAVIASIATGNPMAGASMLAFLEGAPQYEEAREAGKGIAESSYYGGLSTLGTAVLEYLPIGRMLQFEGGVLTGAAKGALEEGLGETAQTVWQNLIAKVGYDDTRGLAEGVVESIIGGAGSGGAVAGATAKYNQYAKRLRDQGVSEQEIKQATDDILGQFQEAVAEKKQDIQTEGLEKKKDGMVRDIATKKGVADPEAKQKATESIRFQKKQAAKEIQDELVVGETSPDEPEWDKTAEAKPERREEHAREIREDKKKTPAPGIAVEQGEGVGRKDLQRAERLGTKASEQKAPEAEGIKPEIITIGGEQLISQGGKWYNSKGKVIPYSQIKKRLEKIAKRKGEAVPTPKDEVEIGGGGGGDDDILTTQGTAQESLQVEQKPDSLTAPTEPKPEQGKGEVLPEKQLFQLGSAREARAWAKKNIDLIEPDSVEVQKESAGYPAAIRFTPKQGKSLEQPGGWFIDADDKPVWLNGDQDKSGYRGPYSKRDIADLTGVEYSSLKKPKKASPELVSKPKSDTSLNTSFIENKVMELGSIEAVEQFYDSDDAVSRYAREFAGKVFKSKEPSQEKPEADIKEILEDSEIGKRGKEQYKDWKQPSQKRQAVIVKHPSGNGYAVSLGSNQWVSGGSGPLGGGSIGQWGTIEQARAGTTHLKPSHWDITVHESLRGQTPEKTIEAIDEFEKQSRKNIEEDTKIIITPGATVTWQGKGGKQMRGTVEKANKASYTVKGEDGKTYAPRMEKVAVVGKEDVGAPTMEKAPKKAETQKTDTPLKLSGLYDNTGETPKDITEYGSKRSEKNFKKDLKKFAEGIKAKLGYEPETGKKGKDESVTTNIAPIGGNGTILLWKPNSEYGVYVSIPVERDYDNDNLKVESVGYGDKHIMWRVTTKKDKWSGLRNHFVGSDITVDQLAEKIKKEIDWVERSAEKKAKQETPEPTPTKKAADMTPDELMAEWDRQAGEVEKATAKDKAKETKEHIAKAVDIFKDINKILGERGSFSTEFDEGKWELIKPLLKQAWSEVVAAGKSGSDFVALALKNLSPKGKPYFEKFVREEINKEVTDATTDYDGEQERQETKGTDDRSGDRGKSTEAVSEAEKERTVGTDSKTDRTADDGGLQRPGTRSDTRSGEKPSKEPDGIRSKARDGAKGSLERDRGKSPGVQRRDHVISKGTLERQGSWKKSAERNLDAIELYKKIEQENRPATPEEQKILAQYVGWGASELANKMFPGYAQYRKIMENWADESWKPLVNRLQKVMTKDEIKTAAQSTQYAHYTSEGVIRSIYKALDKMGFDGGKILEPGLGIGHFIGCLPDNMRKSTTYTGVEMDKTSAGIARLLYPEQNILNADFSKQTLPKDFFDAAIGNPPFGDIPILADPEYKKYRFTLHNYFFAKALDRVRPGGLLVFVTSRYTMDSRKDRARQYMADRADLLGAIRLPQTAFTKNAGTEVVTDLFLRKREDGEAPAGESWMGLDEVAIGDDNAFINEYFVKHPEMVLGVNSLEGSMYASNQYTVKPIEGEIEDLFKKAANKLPKGVYSKATQKAKEAHNAQAIIERDFDPKNKKEGGLYVSDKGELMVVNFGSGVPLSSLKKISAKDKAFLADYTKLRDALKLSHKAQLEDGDWETALKNLNAEYDKFVKKNGPLLAYKNVTRTVQKEDGSQEKVDTRRLIHEKLLKNDAEFSLVLTLESITDDGKIVKSVTLKDRVINRPSKPKVKSIPDALAVSMDQIGKLDIDHIAEIAGKDRREVIDTLGDLVYQDVGSNDYVMADEYLSGNVRQKLDDAIIAAESDPVYQRNVEALKKVQPDPLGPSDITVLIGGNWIPQRYYNEFAAEVLELRSPSIGYDSRTGTWSVTGSFSPQGMRDAGQEWGTAKRGVNEILESLLNNRTIKITETFKVEGGGTKTIVDQEQTAAANEIAKKMRGKFSTWVWQDKGRADDLLDIYNRKFNNIAPRKFDGSHLTLPGVTSKIKLHDHQKDAIWRIIQSGNTYLNHSVGAGKTFAMIAAGMEMRRLGMVNKPLYVVPKHMLSQFAQEFQELYPMANVMVADEENFHTHNRKRFVAQATMNNPDAIVMTHSSFGLIKSKEENVNPVRNEFIYQMQYALEDMKDEGESKFKIKRMEKEIEKAEQRFDSLIGDGDNVVSFEELGVDFMFVDEAHEFRKLDFATNRQIKGIDSKGSKKAIDLYIKTLWLDKMSRGRSHVFASGTPIVNTMGEMYTIMRFFDMAGLEQDGLEHFDSWANMFGEPESAYEMNAAGNYEVVERFSSFVNIPEMMSRVRQYTDVLTSKELGTRVTRPDIKGGTPEIVLAPKSQALKAYQDNVLQPRIETCKKWKPSKDQPGNPDPMINIITDGRLASIDLRFVDPEATTQEKSKLDTYIDGIIDTYKETKGNEYLIPGTDKKSPVKGGCQICFYNVGFGKNVAQTRGFDARAWAMKRFKKAGIPADHVAWIEDYDTASKKQVLFKAVRDGKKRILLGSAKKMGTGVNAQTRLTHLHYLDAPWFPADVEQPDGRIIRQGNQNKEVVIKRYATEGSYDATLWQMVSRKSQFIERAWIGNKDVRTLEDVSEASQYEMAAALASGDQRVIELAGLKADVERLMKLETAHGQDQSKLSRDKRQKNLRAGYLQKQVDHLEEAKKKFSEYISKLDATIDGKHFDNRAEFNEALVEKIKGIKQTPKGGKVIADVNGIKVSLYRDTWNISLAANLTDDAYSTLFDGMQKRVEGDLYASDLATKIINVANRLPSTISETRRGFEETEKELDRMNKRLGAPFEYKRELKEKYDAMVALERELAGEGEQGESTGPDTEGKTEIKVEDEQDKAYSTKQTPPLSQINLETVKNHPRFKTATVTQSKDGKISVRFKNGLGFTINSVESVDENSVTLNVGYGRHGLKKGERVAGFYDHTNKSITIVEGVGDQFTVDHELLHFLEKSGVLTPMDISALNKAIRRNGGTPNEESRARFVEGAFRARDAQKGPVQRVLQKIADFVDLVVNRLGIRTARGVLSDIDSGRIFDGKKSNPVYEFAQNTVYSIKDAMKKIADNPKFREWFGDSVVVDDDGEPLVLNHATSEEFEVFDKEFLGEGVDSNTDNLAARASARIGFWFSDKDLSGDMATDNSKVKKVFLKIENPYEWDMGVFDLGEEVLFADDRYEGDRLAFDEDEETEILKAAPEKFVSRLKEEGYDGIILQDDEFGGTSYIVFESTQVKSIYNKGEFDPDNPDILYSTKQYEKENGPVLQKETFDTIDLLKDTFKTMRHGWEREKPDTNWFHRTFSLASHHAKNVPAYYRVFQAALNKQTHKDLLESQLFNTADGESMLNVMRTFKRRFKGEVKKWDSWIYKRDQNKHGYLVKRDINGEGQTIFKLLSPKPKDGSKRRVVSAHTTENNAWNEAIERECRDYIQAGGSLEGAKALAAYRKITHNTYAMMAKGINDLIAICEAQGEPLPETAYYTDEGNKINVNLKQALIMMGDMRGYYMPRIRKAGVWTLYAEKEGENPIFEKADFKTTLSYKAAKLRKKGYSVDLGKSSAMPEDLFEMLGNVVATQSILNRAMESMDEIDVKRTLDDLNIKGKWEGDTYAIKGSGVNFTREEVFKSLGFEKFERKKLLKNGMAFIVGYQLKDAPKDIEQKLARTVFEAENIAPDIRLDFAKKAVKEFADTIKARGSRARMISRGPETGKDVVEGYEKDPMIAITQAGQSIAGGESKKRMAFEMTTALMGTDVTWQDFKAYNQDPTGENPSLDILEQDLADAKRHGIEKNIKDAERQLELFQSGGDYMDYINLVKSRKIDPAKQRNAFSEATTLQKDMLRNDERIDRITGMIRGLAVFKYLAGRVAAPVVNLTNMAIGVPAAMKGYAGIDINKTYKHIGRAMNLYRKYKFGDRNKLSPEIRQMFDDIEARGFHRAQYNQEAMAILQSKMGKAWNKTMEWGMAAFGASEQINRVATIAGTYLALKAQHKGPWTMGDGKSEHNNALDIAKEVSDKAHGIYGKANRPNWLRGDNLGANIGKAGYVFKTFSHNYLLTLKELGWDKKEYKAAMYMLMAPAMFGTGASLGASAIIQAIGAAVGSDDPEEDFFGYLETNFGGRTENFARYGVTSLLPGGGISLKGNLAIGIMDVPTTISDLLGAPGSIGTDTWEGVKQAKRGNYMKAAEKALPLAIGNIFKGVRESTEGVTNYSNAPVFFEREPIKGDVIDAVYRALSFNPAAISEKKERLWSQKKIDQRYQEMRYDLYSKLRKFYMLPAEKRDRGDMVKIIEEIYKYNARAKLRGQRLITKQSVRASLKRAYRPR